MLHEQIYCKYMDLESWEDSSKTLEYELTATMGVTYRHSWKNCKDSEVDVSTCPEEMRVPRKFLSKIVYLTYEGAHSDALDT